MPRRGALSARNHRGSNFGGIDEATSLNGGIDGANGGQIAIRAEFDHSQSPFPLLSRNQESELSAHAPPYQPAAAGTGVVITGGNDDVFRTPRSGTMMPASTLRCPPPSDKQLSVLQIKRTKF